MTTAGQVRPVIPPCWPGQGCQEADQRAVQSWCWLPGHLKAGKVIKTPPQGSRRALWQAGALHLGSWSPANTSLWAAHLLPALWRRTRDHLPSCVRSCRAQRSRPQCSTAQCPAHARWTSLHQLSTGTHTGQQHLSQCVSAAIRECSLGLQACPVSLALLSGHDGPRYDCHRTSKCCAHAPGEQQGCTTSLTITVLPECLCFVVATCDRSVPEC